MYIIVFEDKGSNDDYTDSFWFPLLFLCSICFLIVPLLCNVLQLHFEVLKWLKDPALKNTQAYHWVKTKVKLLYFISVICGSSFSAIALCNSYLLQLSPFSMGLSRYHRSIFQNKRFFSIVLLENIPQLAIQIATLILTIY